MTTFTLAAQDASLRSSSLARSVQALAPALEASWADFEPRTAFHLTSARSFESFVARFARQYDRPAFFALLTALVARSGRSDLHTVLTAAQTYLQA